MKKTFDKFFSIFMRVQLFILSLFCFAFTFSNVIIGICSPGQKLSYAEAIQLLSEKEVTSITLYSNDDNAEIYLKDNETRYVVNIPNQEAFCEYVQENISSGDVLEMKKITKAGIWQKIIFFVLGTLGMRVTLGKWTKNKEEKSKENKLIELSLTHSNTKIDFSGKIQKSNVFFANVAGLKEEKEELKEIIDFLKFPQKFTEMGAKIPKGVLLSGPPGTGKTLLAKAVAGEAGVSFLSTSGSDFDEMYVGVGASRVRELFEQAQKFAPCIIFIDEIDAVGQKRTSSESRWSTQTIEQLLVAMDGFNTKSNIIVIAATNRPEVLDPALTRPGRLDRNIVIHLPDVHDREEILKIHGKNKKILENVDFAAIAHNTSGFSGAELENLLNEAAILAVRQNQVAISADNIEEAMKKVVLGLQKKGRKISNEVKELTAYHEAGHAVVSKFLSTQNRVKEVSIIPRGTAGGYTWHNISEDKPYASKKELTEKLVVLLGGRAAEQIVLGDISTGASSDLNVATRIAQNMICVYGMNDEIGPISIEDNNQAVLYGGQAIGKAISKAIKEAETKAFDILTKNRFFLNMVANELLIKETISGDELDEIFEIYQTYANT